MQGAGAPARLQLSLGGVVQGVGFRPFVHQLATTLGLGGWVQNCGASVEILVEGDPARLQVFLQRLQDEAPPLARLQILSRQQDRIASARQDFSILPSHTHGSAPVHFPPDTHLCADCRAELFNPADRRYRYPFINCTACGPRYTVVDALPWDRERTAMRDFPLCPACQAEYHDPASRRFHAEVIACPDCGPQLRWQDRRGEAALQAALNALRAGQIIAVRGVGGYHLMCDARNEASLALLRQRKQRPAKPFAILCDEAGEDGAGALRPFVCVKDEELALLRSPQRPIVLVEGGTGLAAGIAPGLARIGVMLPHSPLQALLASGFGGPLVATSGNLSGEPIAIDAAEAETRLGRIADGFLHHDRAIRRPAEDSVWHVAAGAPTPMRLGRGDSPQAWRLPKALPEPVLALGGEQKTCIVLGWQDHAVVSPHIGDLEHPESLQRLALTIADFCRLYAVQPARLLLDAHPGYHARQWAEASGLRQQTVWHHHAHASALAAEYPGIPRWLMLSWDGVGLGPDGTLWGGECLLGSPGQWQRVACLRPFRLPGGEAASRQCWRSALGLCWEAGVDAPVWHPEQVALQAAWRTGLNSPPTSAAGRLFDGFAAQLGICSEASFEGEAPMRLQALAEAAGRGPQWPVRWLADPDGLLQLDWAPWLLTARQATHAPGELAWALHDALARAICELCIRLAADQRLPLGCSGGVFQNRLLLDRLQAHGQTVILPRRQPVNDAGLAIGQIFEYLHHS